MIGLPFFLWYQFLLEQSVKFHPAAQIITWCFLVVTMQALSLGVLMITAGLILLGTLAISGHKFIQLLRRTRWIMLSLLMVYAYSTPGQPVLDGFGMFSPSREGLADGMLQLTRLLAALAGLAILLDRLHRQQLIAGLYTLFAPLRLIGVSRERVAVRLALTLHYAEAAMLRESNTWQDNLRSLFEPHEEASKQMELTLYRFGIGDGLLVGFALLLLFWTLK
jgi:energy-coupling factor transporter transmembrane protein EcfT